LRIIDVVGFEGLYKVSENGIIYTFSNRNGKYNYPLRQNCDKDGYKYVKLFKNGKYHNARVNRVVAQAFIPNPKNKPIVNHIDFDRTNNCVSNLEWTTEKENVQHSVRAGRYNNKRCKKVVSIDKNGNKKIYSSISEAEKETGASLPNIIKVCRGIRPFAKGYKWFYEDEVIIEEVEGE
jgi:uncharacterized OB-fold protein